jgi:type II secretory pathway pseudopilin PulG
MSLVEVMVSLSICMIAMAMFSSAIISTSRLGADQRMTSLAANAARSALEVLRTVTPSERFARFNADPADDPGGAGSAPGPFFAVDGLQPVAGDPDGRVGEYVFATSDGKMREDMLDDHLGLPRDLNGDTLIDELDHANDYKILPVAVRIRWAGVTGPRSVTLYTMMVDLGSAP